MNKVAIITGAAGGIGFSTSELFVKDGYVTIAVDIKEPVYSDALKDASNYEFYKVDVSDEEQVKNFVGLVEKKHGRVDVLANIAGIVLVKPIEEISWPEYRKVVDVNLGGTFLMIKYVVPIMKRQRSGAIINMASVSGHVGQIRHSIYGMTKGGIIALTKALAWELADYRIRVNSVSPGSIDTEMLRSDIKNEAKRLNMKYEEVKQMREKEQAFGRWADPIEVAKVIRFLASDDASFINGADILVDNGWVAK